MFADYKAQITLAYKKKKTSGGLSLNLLHSTPAKLRAECTIVLNERYLKKDEPILRVFFAPKDDANAYMQAIRKFDADKFKPLDNFLKGITNDTEDKNIELLAWLINFEPRPYKFGQINVASEPEVIYGSEKESLSNKIVEEVLPANIVSNLGRYGDKKENWQAGYQTVPPLYSQTKEPNKTKPKFKLKIWIILLVVIAAVGFGIFAALHYKKKSPSRHYTAAMIGNQKCMYWTGDNYQPTLCNQKFGDTMVIALDTVRLNHFKKITEPDTVTSYSIGKLWYFMFNGHIELYTTGGYHPILVDRRLLPLSQHMLNKYILHKR